jgi:signal peptidase I
MRTWRAALAVLGPALAVVLVTVRRRLLVVTVRGVSMQPTYQAGDRVLVRRTRRARSGQVVVLRMPDTAERVDPAEDGLLVKRVVAAAGEPVPPDVPPGSGTVPRGHVVVRGDGTRSYDSRQWGAIPAGLVEGVAVLRLGPGASPAGGGSR